MVGGVLRCLGSNQRLRSRYGLGYQLEISLVIPTSEEVQSQLEEIRRAADVPAAQGSDPKFTRPQLVKIFTAIQRGKWISRISETGTGAELHSAIQMLEYVAGHHLASWIILEEAYDILCAFLDTEFPGYILRERQTSKVRVEVPSRLASGGTRKLSEMFGAIESQKDRLRISEYSVSQTSLEQIFNFFAAQQEEEKGVAQGLH